MDGLQPKPNEEYSANDQTEENIHKRSLYDRLGGENNIILIVDYFYEFVQLDNLVNYFFFRSDMIQQRNNMKKYMTFLTGGSIQYTGRSMKQTHEKLGISRQHFEAVEKHLREAMSRCKILPELIEETMQKVYQIAGDIVSPIDKVSEKFAEIDSIKDEEAKKKKKLFQQQSQSQALKGEQIAERSPYISSNLQKILYGITVYYWKRNVNQLK